MRLEGESQEPSGDDARTFVQCEPGFSRQDSRRFAKRWKRTLLRLPNLIGNGMPIAISISEGSHSLAAPNVSACTKPLARAISCHG